MIYVIYLIISSSLVNCIVNLSSVKHSHCILNCMMSQSRFARGHPHRQVDSLIASLKHVKTKLELRWVSSWLTFHGTAANAAKQKMNFFLTCVNVHSLPYLTWPPVITAESQPSRTGPGPHWNLGSPLHASLQAQQALRLRKMAQLGQRGHGEGAPPLPGTEAREGRNLGRLRATGPGAIQSTTNKQTNTDKIWELNCQQRNYHFTIHNRLPVLLAHKSSHLRRSS